MIKPYRILELMQRIVLACHNLRVLYCLRAARSASAESAVTGKARKPFFGIGCGSESEDLRQSHPCHLEDWTMDAGNASHTAARTRYRSTGISDPGIPFRGMTLSG